MQTVIADIKSLSSSSCSADGSGGGGRKKRSRDVGFSSHRGCSFHMGSKRQRCTQVEINKDMITKVLCLPLCHINNNNIQQ